MYIEDFDHALTLYNLFTESDFADRDPELKQACVIFWETGNRTYLQQYIWEYPNAINEAIRANEEKRRMALDEPFSPYPEGDELNLLKGDIGLGWVNGCEDITAIYARDLPRILFINGMPGVGKTTLIKLMVAQALSIPKEERGYSILIIQDTKRDMDAFIRMSPLKVIEFKDLRLNIWEVESWDTIEAKQNAIIEIFSCANWFMKNSQPILTIAAKIAYESSKTTGLPPNFSEIKELVPQAIKAIGLKGFEHRNVADNVNFSLETFIQTGPILNCRFGLTVEDFWSQEDVILNLMDVASPYIKSTITMTLFKEIQRHNNEKFNLS